MIKEGSDFFLNAKFCPILDIYNSPDDEQQIRCFLAACPMLKNFSFFQLVNLLILLIFAISQLILNRLTSSPPSPALCQLFRWQILPPVKSPFFTLSQQTLMTRTKEQNGKAGEAEDVHWRRACVPSASGKINPPMTIKDSPISPSNVSCLRTG